MGNAAITWESRKQRTVALSSAEAEYMSLSDACREVRFLRSFIGELAPDFVQNPTVVYSDSQSAQAIANNQILNNRTKHIDVKHHFIRECVLEFKQIKLKYMTTDEMIADVLTKPLCKVKHNNFCNCMGLKESKLRRSV